MAEKKIQASKVEAVKNLKDQFADVGSYFFTDYRGLTVEKITDLRNKLRDVNAEYHVVKNNFAKIALDQLEKPDVSNLLVGPTAMALAFEEAGPVAKVLVDFARDNSVEVRGGLVDLDVFDEVEVVAFSKLPTKPELISMLMSTMKAPLQNFVFAINGVPTKLVRTVQAVADQKAEEA